MRIIPPSEIALELRNLGENGHDHLSGVSVVVIGPNATRRSTRLIAHIYYDQRGDLFLAQRDVHGCRERRGWINHETAISIRAPAKASQNGVLDYNAADTEPPHAFGSH
jgi:hypothetical protein